MKKGKMGRRDGKRKTRSGRSGSGANEVVLPGSPLFRRGRYLPSEIQDARRRDEGNIGKVAMHHSYGGFGKTGGGKEFATQLASEDFGLPTDATEAGLIAETRRSGDAESIRAFPCFRSSALPR